MPTNRTSSSTSSTAGINRKLSEAWFLGSSIGKKRCWVQLELGKKTDSSREKPRRHRAPVTKLPGKAGAQIPDVKTIKEAGSPGVLSGKGARLQHFW